MVVGRKPPSYPKHIITNLQTTHTHTLLWQTDTMSTDWINSLSLTYRHALFFSSQWQQSRELVFFFFFLLVVSLTQFENTHSSMGPCKSKPHARTVQEPDGWICQEKRPCIISTQRAIKPVPSSSLLWGRNELKFQTKWERDDPQASRGKPRPPPQHTNHKHWYIHWLPSDVLLA